MEQYVKVQKPKMETTIDENEIRITSQGRMRNYITYAMTLLQEKGSNEIVFKAMGRAINKTVTIVELIKRRIVGLHQITSIGSIDITDTWEPLEEGLLPYQPPIRADQVIVTNDFDYGDGFPNDRGRGRGGRGRGRGRGRGPAGNGYMTNEFEEGGFNENLGYSRGDRGRGRGRGFRGRGRGGFDYNAPIVDTPQDAGGYYRGPPSESHGGGRGRGGRGRGPRGGGRSNGPTQEAA